MNKLRRSKESKVVNRERDAHLSHGLQTLGRDIQGAPTAMFNYSEKLYNGLHCTIATWQRSGKGM